MNNQPNSISPVKLILKAIVFFVIFNVLYYLVQPMTLVNKLSVYNVFVPGRDRFAFSDNYPAESYSISILNLDQMFASHQIAAAKAPDEYRVVMLGDSAVWGYLLKASDTQAACLNRLNLAVPSGKKARFYNLGYPKLTVVKDLLLLRHALAYQPDLIVWSTSLASLYTGDQLDFPIITANYDEVARLVDQYHFKLDQWPLKPPDWLDRTFVGQRRDLANWLRFQLYGMGWMATGVDHTLVEFITPHPTNLVSDDNVLAVNPIKLATDHKFTPADLSFDVMKAGIQMASAQNIPVMVINEPIYRASNNDLRWNTYYSKWAFDTYRDAIKETAQQENWHYVDLWDAMPPEQFTDTDFHLNAEASCVYAARLSEPIMALAK